MIEMYIHLPEYQEALRMARELVNHCGKHNMPKNIKIYGVAVFSSYIEEKCREEGIVEGKAYERGRIAKLLGLV